MKRKSWLFILYSVAIITAIVLLLIFWPKNDDDLTENPDEIIQDGDSDIIEESEIYATSLDVNLPATINILKGNSINLLAGYVQVLPNEAFDKVKVEIVPRYNSSAFGVELVGSTLTAQEVGTYNLIFSVQKSASAKFTRTFLISVYEEKINSHVTQTRDALTIYESANINELFNIKNSSSCSVVVDDKCSYISNIITATKVGSGVIKLVFTEGYVQYIYEFEIVVKHQPEYYFVLNNVENNTIEINMSETSVFHLNFSLKDRNGEDAVQNIIATIEDETIASIFDVSNPLIKISALKTGSTTLTLKCENDTSVFIEITVIVI